MKLTEKFFGKDASYKIENTVISKSSEGCYKINSPIKDGEVFKFDYKYSFNFPLYKVLLTLFGLLFTFALFHANCVKRYKKSTENKLRARLTKKYKKK